jgi:hypothetical protein
MDDKLFRSLSATNAMTESSRRRRRRGPRGPRQILKRIFVILILGGLGSFGWSMYGDTVTRLYNETTVSSPTAETLPIISDDKADSQADISE